MYLGSCWRFAVVWKEVPRCKQKRKERKVETTCTHFLQEMLEFRLLYTLVDGPLTFKQTSASVGSSAARKPASSPPAHSSDYVCG